MCTFDKEVYYFKFMKEVWFKKSQRRDDFIFKVVIVKVKIEPHGPESIVGVHDAVNHKVHHHEPDMRHNVFIR